MISTYAANQYKGKLKKKYFWNFILYLRLSMFHFLYIIVPVRTLRIVWLQEMPAWVILSRGK